MKSSCLQMDGLSHMSKYFIEKVEISIEIIQETVSVYIENGYFFRSHVIIVVILITAFDFSF